MRRPALVAVLLLPLAAAGSQAARPPAEDAPPSLDQARAEWQAAEAETKKLEAASAKAASEAARLGLEREAGAAAIAAAEARISAAEAELRLRQQAVAAARGRLAARQRPVAALVAGLVNLERRPPLLTLASDGSVDELVRTRALLGALIPHVRRQSRSLSAELANARHLEADAGKVAKSLGDAKAELGLSQQRFAALETKALARSSELGQAVVESGDEAILAGEGFERLETEQRSQANARQLAALLSRVPPAPPRPVGSDSRPGRAPFAYVLPVSADVADGLGTVNDAGIRSRGIRFESWRGAPVVMPAKGKIVFAGPYRRYDGVVIIDHGNGWLTMLLNVRADHERGASLEAGEPLGKALGEIGVELSHDGNFVSPAEIALRSRSLSIQGRQR